MKILVVTYFCNPNKYNGSVQVMNKTLIEGFNSINDDVDYIALIDDIGVKELIEKQYSNLNFLSFLPLNYQNSSSIADNLIGFKDAFLPNAYKLDIKKITETYDYIISISSLSASINVAHYIMRKQKSKKYVQIFTDPIYLQTNHKSLFRKFLLQCRKIFSKKMMKTADDIFFLGKPMCLYQSKLFKKLSCRMHYYNGMFSTMYPVDYCKEHPENKIGYFGSYDPKIRNINPLVEAMGILKDYTLQIFGNGKVDVKIPENVTVHNKRYNHEQIFDFEINSDVYVCVMNYSAFSIPGKIFYIAATNIPILVLYDDSNTEMYHYLKEFDRFVFCKNEPPEIAKAIKNITCPRNDKAKEMMCPQLVVERILETSNRM